MTKQSKRIQFRETEMIEDFLDNLSYQSFYWKRFGVAFRSWHFRMTTLSL